MAEQVSSVDGAESNRSFKQAAVFIAATFLISWIEQYFIVRGGGIQNPIPVFALMWTPGLVAILCSYYFDRNFKALALKIPNARSLLLAYFVPALVAALMVVFLLLFNQAEFQVSPKLIAKEGSLVGALLAALVMAPTVGMLLAVLSGWGEEIGWRGFLHSKLMHLKSSHRYLLTGIVWSIWHWPLIIFGDYATSDKPWLNILFFTGTVLGVSFLMGWLRDHSKSSFPAALAHASHNMWILGVAPAFLNPGPLVPYFGGESGFYCALLYILLAAVIYLKALKKSETMWSAE